MDICPYISKTAKSLELFNSPLKELHAFFLRTIRKPMQGRLESASSTTKKLVNCSSDLAIKGLIAHPTSSVSLNKDFTANETGLHQVLARGRRMHRGYEAASQNDVTDTFPAEEGDSSPHYSR
jgi:hypothetical protein